MTFLRLSSLSQTQQVVLESQTEKKATFFLPSKVSIKSNNIIHFTVQILGNKVDCGELPHVTFQPNIFKSALDMMFSRDRRMRRDVIRRTANQR